MSNVRAQNRDEDLQNFREEQDNLKKFIHQDVKRNKKMGSRFNTEIENIEMNGNSFNSILFK
jgi:hypothetical protein